MNDPVGLGRELVAAGSETVVGSGGLQVRLQPREQRTERRLLDVRPEAEDRVDALAGDHVVEGEEALRQILKDGKDVVPAASDDAEAQLVEDLGGDRLLLRKELGDERVLVLSATDELDHREAGREHAPDDAIDLFLD